MHLELTSFMMRAVMEIFFPPVSFFLKVLFQVVFQFTLSCHCFLQVTTTSSFLLTFS